MKDNVDGYRQTSITFIAAAVTSNVFTESPSANLSHHVLYPYSGVPPGHPNLLLKRHL